ncbi:ABC transporter permease [Gorillibacterium timonense]|uniref:ABC transporter permease n=1 Tax=Gorillibacterium timonense TaxID=1689269 RepID=UPI00071DBB40|nr:ABC transporter permease [Gorillibacterium timonense]
MRSFGLLLWNEWLKIWKKPGFFIPYLLILLLTVITAIVVNNLDPTMFHSAFDYTTGTLDKSGLGKLIALIAVSSTASIVTQEFRFGTVKFLLIRTHSRGSILASKLIITLIYTMSITVFASIAMFVVGGIVFGTQPAAGETWSHLLLMALYQWIYMSIFVLFTFLVGVLTRSSGKAIGAGIFISLLSDIMIPKPFYKYVLFSNVDLSVYSAGHPPLSGMTLGFSAVVLAVYAAAFIGLGFLAFCKRDVA